MTYSQEEHNLQTFNPIENIELFLLGTDWNSERLSDNEILIIIKGKFCEYNTTIHWNEKQNILHYALSFGVGLPTEALSHQNEYALLKLVALLNETIAVGHYDVWQDEHAIVWRYGHILPDDECSHDYLAHIFNLALETCECHFSAFQFVLWAGQSPQEAVKNVMFETAGEA